MVSGDADRLISAMLSGALNGARCRQCMHISSKALLSDHARQTLASASACAHDDLRHEHHGCLSAAD